ncbi:MAG: hypothetical protein HQL16_02915 [Candidatus Omnitrophica bacterium]|nr:hypothetical protein [Candidatus Omnitrophota bacterium]
MNKKFFLTFLGIGILAGFFFLAVYSVSGAQDKKAEINGVFVGTKKADFLEIYPLKKARTYREESGKEWLTFGDPLDEAPKKLVTFHIKEDRVAGWDINDRAEIVKEYLGEFCSGGIVQGGSKTFLAVQDVLMRVPFDVFVNVTNRRHPVLFTEYFDSGTARFANSSEIFSGPDDAPAFEDGIMIMKLSTELDSADSPAAIEGIVAHELAHHVLEHVKKGVAGSCNAEREANRLIKKWGFAKEYEAASKSFGHEKVGGTMACQDK